jgi:hypothetical protein
MPPPAQEFNAGGDIRTPQFPFPRLVARIRYVARFSTYIYTAIVLFALYRLYELDQGILSEYGGAALSEAVVAEAAAWAAAAATIGLWTTAGYVNRIATEIGNLAMVQRGEGEEEKESAPPPSDPEPSHSEPPDAVNVDQYG